MNKTEMVGEDLADPLHTREDEKGIQKTTATLWF